MATLYASAEAIRARANKLDPVKVFIVVVCALPWLLFFVAKFAWFALSVLIAAGLEGWETAGRQIDARRPPADPRGG